jgi:LacI family transcriptional regulator
VLRTARELGLAVPADLSIVGFDNIPEGALGEPPLTTVDQHVQELGRAAVQVLVDLIEHPGRHGESEPIHITLPTELIVRRSTAPPAVST